MTVRPKNEARNERDQSESVASPAGMAKGADAPEVSKLEERPGFSPLDLLRCMDNPFPSKKPVRVASLASLRGRS